MWKNIKVQGPQNRFCLKKKGKSKEGCCRWSGSNFEKQRGEGLEREKIGPGFESLARRLKD